MLRLILMLTVVAIPVYPKQTPEPPIPRSSTACVTGSSAARWLDGDYEPYIYRTDDYGKTWTRLTDGKNGIPADWPTRVVREDPDRAVLLYAGAEFGMFISFDNGAHWQSFQLNLPNVPVSDIKVHHKDLIVSTQGRAIWILDNISSLHQIPSSKPSDITLFKPRDGYRTRTAPTNVVPVVDYYLPTAPAHAVVIELLDSKGEVLNSYNSETPVLRPRGSTGPTCQAPAAPVLNRNLIRTPRQLDVPHRDRASPKPLV